MAEYRKAASGDWAFIGFNSGKVFFAEGPFEKVAQCPIGKTAFYTNNFDLCSPTPWLIPQSIIEIEGEKLPDYLNGGSVTHFEWQSPSPNSFSHVFQEITKEIHDGNLKKSVPVVVEKVEANEDVLASLASRVFPLHHNLFPYGLSIKGAGFAGASPEFLFESFEGKLKTMALAGTARNDERDVFAFDEKEIQEHEFVADTLSKKLTPLGMTKRHARRILDIGSLIHFHTAIDVELYKSHNPDDLIHHLHPTPALGPLPRSTQTMEQLISWRENLECPESFGAPFGLYHEGRLRLLVAIRMVSYENGMLKIPSGCGIIEASRLTNEWRELELKRQSVKKLFRI